MSPGPCPKARLRGLSHPLPSHLNLGFPGSARPPKRQAPKHLAKLGIAHGDFPSPLSESALRFDLWLVAGQESTINPDKVLKRLFALLCLIGITCVPSSLRADFTTLLIDLAWTQLLHSRHLDGEAIDVFGLLQLAISSQFSVFIRADWSDKNDVAAGKTDDPKSQTQSVLIETTWMESIYCMGIPP
ncbi:hypothetical protein SODALDRAFT_362800 [Sodiomyces alkalinus F11]|uniref:Uncharacterized protein n=1 Tax=Sodiomyces alkalinus (strain CBS 110278 / VKM F-3762 / F11) TaxID=1314773 RepID=A0A3N2PN56_SODAK|nr:hypothetical protein SODALDRAFT_362800 [Sodiomyces alkalinus F11]ROT35942.1 hypothetical protein SODALDRAFT_362800 [Sodiomyces alkalinus F11]